jgi:hypothetical protein
MSGFDLDRFKTKSRPAGDVVRDGKRIEVRELAPEAPAQKKRKPFKADSIMMPTAWTASLRQSKCVSTHNLAHWIIEEAFKRKRAIDADIILSTTATGIPRSARCRATSELVALGLIEVRRHGREAFRVTRLLKLPDGWNHAPEGVL